MGILGKGIRIFNSLYSSAISKGVALFYRHQYNTLFRRHHVGKQNNEAEYIAKWKPICKKPHINTFRLFSQYIGPNPNIVPEDVSAGIILPILNPITTRAFYQDKNMFDKIIPSAMQPATIIRLIRGGYYDVDYKLISDKSNALCSLIFKIPFSKIFIKPTIDSCSGVGVIAFQRNKEGEFMTKSGTRLSAEFLKQYGAQNGDFIIQEGLTQSNFFAQFNTTSINTLRVCTYRSFKDNKSHVTSALLRIGKAGSEVDNAHAGGLFIGVSMDGKLGKYVCNQYGDKFSTFNDVDFENNDFIIPNFSEIIQFAERIGDCIIHHRLVAQDICIDAEGCPKLIEFNLRGFAPWVFQFVSGPAFGQFADEIIEYCSSHKSDARKVLLEAF